MTSGRALLSSNIDAAFHAEEAHEKKLAIGRTVFDVFMKILHGKNTSELNKKWLFSLEEGGGFDFHVGVEILGEDNSFKFTKSDPQSIDAFVNNTSEIMSFTLFGINERECAIHCYLYKDNVKISEIASLRFC